MTESDSSRAWIRGLFRDEDTPEPVPTPEAPTAPPSGPVIPGQESMPGKVTDNPLKVFARELFDR